MAQTRLSTTRRALLTLLAETPVHAGMGAQLGVVDLPIQRERHTEWPTIYGSGLKGVFRDHAGAAGWVDAEVNAVFGPETDKGGRGEDSRYAGALALSDAKLLLFPVRTVGHAFAWVTCPLALARLLRDAEQAGLKPPSVLAQHPDEDHAAVAPSWPAADKGVLIEEFRFDAQVDASVGLLGEWIGSMLLPSGSAYAYWRGHAQKALAVVSDDNFHDFVRHGTEIVTRVKLEADTKTVARGALWTEENLPTDSLLYSVAVAWSPASTAESSLKSAEQVIDRFADLLTSRPVVQVGGKETVGRGFVAVRFAGGTHA